MKLNRQKEKQVAFVISKNGNFGHKKTVPAIAGTAINSYQKNKIYVI